MIDTPVWLGPLINGVVMSGVLLVVFQVQERYKVEERARSVRHTYCCGAESNS